MEEKNLKQTAIIIFLIVVVLSKLVDVIYESSDRNFTLHANDSTTLNIIASSENEDLEEIIQDYVQGTFYDVNIEYAGTLDIMQKLNAGEQYDAVWTSNSIWVYMLNDNVKVKASKCTSINPIIFGIKKSKAEQLGFIGRKVYTQDIVNAISEGKLKFSMSNPTSTNSGASAYLGLLSTLAGNPEVLKEENIQDEALKENLTTLFSGMERSSGSEDFLEELFLNGDYEAVVTYESSIININKQLIQQGKEPLYAIYPVDGVSISDSPFAYIDHDDDTKASMFADLQSYILSDDGQKALQEKGRRTWYGGISDKVDKTIFNPDWGIDTTTYISPIKYPSTAVIKSALTLYQSELRKPVHVAFCLDYSGSMAGDGIKQLTSAMDYILTDKAANDLLQFSEKDKIDIIPFGSRVYDIWSTSRGSETENLISHIHEMSPSGSTALYPAAIQALEQLKGEDVEIYNSSIILMTDGQANVGRYNDLVSTYRTIQNAIPIYSILFGNADERELEDIAELTNAKVFNGKTDLIKAFKEVRGYN